MTKKHNYMQNQLHNIYAKGANILKIILTTETETENKQPNQNVNIIIKDVIKDNSNKQNRLRAVTQSKYDHSQTTSQKENSIRIKDGHVKPCIAAVNGCSLLPPYLSC